jgi:hypothetical protein
MSKFIVIRRVDAYVVYSAVVKARNAQQAAWVAEMNEGDFEWTEEDVVQYDARHFVALDKDGEEIEGTKTGKG